MKIDNRPLIGIILDENTSNGGRFYETNKGYFRAIYEAGGAPIGLPYEKTSLQFAIQNCQGLLSTGARIQFPDYAYIEGEKSTSPYSDRFAIEADLIKAFVDADKPYLGICNGMQLLGVLHGAKMTYQLKAHQKGDIAHDNRETRHKVEIIPNTHLGKIINAPVITTNSHHSEAILYPSDNMIVSAKAEDGTIEAIEIKNKKFAIGVQWHPELMWPTPQGIHDENSINSIKKLFCEFIDNCN